MLLKSVSSIIENHGFALGVDVDGRETVYWDVKGTSCHVAFIAWLPTTELPRLIPVMFQDGCLNEAAHLKRIFDASTVTIEIQAREGFGELKSTVQISGVDKASQTPELDIRAVNALKRAVLHLSKEACKEAAHCIQSYLAVPRVDTVVVYERSTQRFRVVVEKRPVQAHVHPEILQGTCERSASMLRRIVDQEGVELVSFQATLYKKRDDQGWHPVSQALVDSVVTTVSDNWAQGHVAGAVKAAIHEYRVLTHHLNKGAL